MALIGSNTNVNVTRMLGGAKDARGISQVAQGIAEQSGPVVQDGLGGSVQKSMETDLRKLKLEMSSIKGVSQSGMNAALMTAGAILSGPAGVVPISLAERLNTAVSSKETRKALAEQAIAATTTGSDKENAQMSHLGVEVTSALVKEGVKGSNVPTALFMGGAIQHHQSEA